MRKTGLSVDKQAFDYFSMHLSTGDGFINRTITEPIEYVKDRLETPQLAEHQVDRTIKEITTAIDITEKLVTLKKQFPICFEPRRSGDNLNYTSNGNHTDRTFRFRWTIGYNFHSIVTNKHKDLNGFLLYLYRTRNRLVKIKKCAALRESLERNRQAAIDRGNAVHETIDHSINFSSTNVRQDCSNNMINPNTGEPFIKPN